MEKKVRKNNFIIATTLLLSILGGGGAVNANPLPIEGDVWKQNGMLATTTEWNRNFKVIDQGNNDNDGSLDNIDDYIAASLNTGTQSNGRLSIVAPANAGVAPGFGGQEPYVRFVGDFDFEAKIKPYPNNHSGGYTSLLVQLESSISDNLNWNIRVNGIAPVSSGKVKTSTIESGFNIFRGWALFQLANRSDSYTVRVKSKGNIIYERLHSMRIDTVYTDLPAPLSASLKGMPEKTFPQNMLTFESNSIPAGFNGNWILATPAQELLYPSKTYSNKNIDDNQTSQAELKMTFSNSGTLSFDYAISTEENYDFFNFYIDGVLKLSRSGYNPQMTVVNFPISKGEHTLKWEYKKDFSVSDEYDSVWIDNLRFLPTLGAISQ